MVELDPIEETDAQRILDRDSEVRRDTALNMELGDRALGELAYEYSCPDIVVRLRLASSILTGMVIK